MTKYLIAFPSEAMVHRRTGPIAMFFSSLTRRSAGAALGLALALAVPGLAQAQGAPVRAEAANKELVLSFWRDVFDAQDWAKAKDYLSEDYIQHNPNVASGLKGFNEFFSKLWPSPKPKGSVVATPFAVVIAEGDLVQLVMKRPRPEPGDPAKTYDSYWFDLFRVKDGKIVEHWDSALKPVK